MNNYFELKVVNKPLYYVELISCLNSFAENRIDIKLKDFFSPEEIKFIEILKTFKLKGREFFEFALYIDKLDDLDYVLEKLNALSQTEFIFTFFGDSISKAETEMIYKDYSKTNELLSEKIEAKWLTISDLDILFNQTNYVKENLINILRKIDNFIKHENIIDNDIYIEKVKELALKLKEKAPLNLAQEIMGKKFQRFFDFNLYLFVPSFYFCHKPMRIFNNKTQILIYPIKDLNPALATNELAKILKIISDKSRLDIIKSLSHESYSGKELASKIGVSTPTISHHLDQLKSIGLLYEERDKNTKYYTLNKNTYKEIIETLNNYL